MESSKEQNAIELPEQLTPFQMQVDIFKKANNKEGLHKDTLQKQPIDTKI